MDFEFHYYIIGIVARAAGFSENETKIISFASQLVDDNTIIYDVKDRKTDEIYSNYVSQTINVLKPRKTLLRIYSVFHFIPGDPMAKSARRCDGKMHILNTTANSELSKYLMEEAFKSSNLYRIGIATHGYADTWAHQNFIGCNDSMNNMDVRFIPNIGHSDAFFDPDRVNREWVDSRLVNSKINNNSRFIKAAENTFYLYTKYLGSNCEWNKIRKDLLHIMSCPKQSDRLNEYYKLVGWLPPYHKRGWFDGSIEQKVMGLKDSDNELLSKFTIFKDEYWWKDGIKKENTNWFKFQEAIKDHQTVALIPIYDICKYMRLDMRSF